MRKFLRGGHVAGLASGPVLALRACRCISHNCRDGTFVDPNHPTIVKQGSLVGVKEWKKHQADDERLSLAGEVGISADGPISSDEAEELEHPKHGGVSSGRNQGRRKQKRIAKASVNLIHLQCRFVEYEKQLSPLLVTLPGLVFVPTDTSQRIPPPRILRENMACNQSFINIEEGILGVISDLENVADYGDKGLADDKQALMTAAELAVEQMCNAKEGEWKRQQTLRKGKPQVETGMIQNFLGRVISSELSP
jgi:hypothetical protein